MDEQEKALRDWTAPLYREQSLLEIDPEHPQMVVGEDVGKPIGRFEHFSDALKDVHNEVSISAGAWHTPEEKVVGETALSAIARAGVPREHYRNLRLIPKAGEGTFHYAHRQAYGLNGAEGGGTMQIDFGPGVHDTMPQVAEKPDGGRALEVRPPLASPSEYIGTATMHELGHHMDPTPQTHEIDVHNRAEAGLPVPDHEVVELGVARGLGEAHADQYMLDHWKPAHGENPHAAVSMRNHGYQSEALEHDSMGGGISDSIATAAGLNHFVEGTTNPAHFNVERALSEHAYQASRRAVFHTAVHAAANAYLSQHPPRSEPSPIHPHQGTIPGL